jgi:hypothetical protein
MRDKLEALGHHTAKYAAAEISVVDRLCEAFEESNVTLEQKLQTFPRHVRRQDIARFLVKNELFKLALPANGNVVECGVFAGGGLFSWMHFSAVYEPYNHTRRIIGFDTFSGFPGIHAKDLTEKKSVHSRVGAFQTNKSIMKELGQLAEIHDANRPLGHIEKIELVEGNATHTIPDYVKNNPSLLISLLYLDFDLYEPTKVALETLLPRMVKGGVVAFDELNCPEFAGETTALLETLSANSIELRRFPMDPYISYFIR